MFLNLMDKARRFFRSPVYMPATIGLIGFAIDMAVKPISNSGLVLLGVACSPWLTRLIKSAKVAGVEFELAPAAPPAETGARLAEEVEAQLSQLGLQQADPTAPSDSTGTTTVPPGSIEFPSPITGSGGSLFAPSQQVANAYLAEGLAIQELQREVGGLLQKEVLISGDGRRRQILDALLITTDETVAIEVKLLSRPLSAIIEQTVDRLRKVPLELRRLGYPNPRLIVAFVTTFDSEEQTGNLKRKMSEALAHTGIPKGRIELRHFQLGDLLSKYGFEAGEKSRPSDEGA